MASAPDLVVEGFHGPGGWAEGRRILGLTTLAVGMEWDAAACATAKAAGHTVVRCDVAQYPTAPFRGRIVGKVDSPPCQAWSRAGKGLGLVDQPLVHQAVEDLAAGRDTRATLLTACKDPRSLLAAEPMRWHHDLRPEWIAMEEVPDVLPLWKQYAAILRTWGYSVWCGILNAADYGVPQTRRRALLIASRVRDITAPDATHAEHPMHDLFGDCRKPWTTMAEALGWAAGQIVNTRGDRKTPGGNDFSADGPSWALTEKARSWVLRNGNQPNAAERGLDEPAPTMAFGHNSARVEWVFKRTAGGYERLDPNKPAPAVKPGNPSGASSAPRFDDLVILPSSKAFVATQEARDMVGAPTHTVRITQAEAAVLQSFPADYPWKGTKTKQFEQIGNAVPPLLAAHVLASATGIRLAEAADGQVAA